jgi:hypothetical protein
MFGLHILLLARQAIHSKVDQVNTSQSSKGTQGKYGAVSVRFKIADTTFCFLNCFLEPGQSSEARQKRSWMLKEICADSFKQERGTIYQYFDVHEHDIKVFFGDMNFRSEAVDFDLCLQQIAAQSYNELLKKDEFYLHREKDHLLRTMAEGPVTFAPTYKYICGTNNYDRNVIPAYCDRVLFSTKQPGSLKQVYYNRAEINVSEHKPVTAVFEAEVHTIDQTQHRIYASQFAAKFNQFNQDKLKQTIADRIQQATMQAIKAPIVQLQEQPRGAKQIERVG